MGFLIYTAMSGGDSSLVIIGDGGARIKKSRGNYLDGGLQNYLEGDVRDLSRRSVRLFK